VLPEGNTKQEKRGRNGDASSWGKKRNGERERKGITERNDEPPPKLA